jgi:hypothetical protein
LDRFNPVAPTLLRKAIIELLGRAKPDYGTQKEVKEMVEKITQSSNGDIRSAVTVLEFICGGGNIGDATKAKKGQNSKCSRSDRTL